MRLTIVLTLASIRVCKHAISPKSPIDWKKVLADLNTKRPSASLNICALNQWIYDKFSYRICKSSFKGHHMELNVLLFHDHKGASDESAHWGDSDHQYNIYLIIKI